MIERKADLRAGQESPTPITAYVIYAYELERLCTDRGFFVSY